MNDTSFDRAMCKLAHREDEDISTARLEQAFACLGDAPGTLATPTLPARPTAASSSSSAEIPRQSVSRTTGARHTATHRARRTGNAYSKRRMALLAFALFTLLAATALAATLGLSHFFEQNPYLFAHKTGSTTDGVKTQPLLMLDDGELRDLRVQPVDSAWIDGRLTLSVLVSLADVDEPLLVGELDGDGTALLYLDGPDQPPQTLDNAASARILLHDSFSVYTMGDDGWSGYPQTVDTMMQDGAALIAMQINPDFVGVSDLDALAQDGRVPFRLEMYLADHGELHAESAILSAVLPTDEEKEVMYP